MSAIAKGKGKLYGAAVRSDLIAQTDFAAAVKRECALLVPESELKWRAVHPQKDVFDFSGYHRLKDFAVANSMQMRGHNLVWHEANPAWLEPALTSRAAATAILQQHIQRVVAETSSFIKDWDVVNEAVSPHSARPDGLRDTLWLRAIGADYIPLAYRIAHDADPSLTLAYNDYDTEYSDGNSFTRRSFILSLLEKLKNQNVPVHALGLQSHLSAHRPLGGKAFTRFLAEVRALGLDVYVTELDINIMHLPGSMDEKIEAGQTYLTAYLDMVQEHAALGRLLTWGLSDRASWLREREKNLAGALPLDAGLHRAPMWETLRKRWAAA